MGTTQQTEGGKEMKLKKGFLTHTIQGTQVMVAAGPAAENFSGIVRSNKTAAFIVDCLKEETTEDAIVGALTGHYDVDTEVAGKDVRRILSQLAEIGAIE
jgi:hypothetical protein